MFIATLMLFFVYSNLFKPMGSLGSVALIGTGGVETIMLLILRSFHKTRYILTEREFHMETAKLIGGENRRALEDGQSVEKTLMPLGIKLFGASFHRGDYNIPGLGRATLAKTNFKEGLPIKTQKRSYIITTKDPISFKNANETNVYT